MLKDTSQFLQGAGDGAFAARPEREGIPVLDAVAEVAVG